MIEHKGRWYHPVPFEEYKEAVCRPDCEDRYRKIFANYGNIKGKSLVDICCAEGFFLFNFVKNGGARAFGVESNLDYVNFVNQLAREKKLNVKASLPLPRDKFDIGIFLDTYSSEECSSEYPKYISTHCKTAYVSASDNGKLHRFFDEVRFKHKEYVFTSWQFRDVYRVDF